MSLASSAARGAAATLGGQWLRFVIQLVALAILARLLTPEDYGLVSMVLATAGVATLLSDFGLSAASIQVQNSTSAQRSNLFWLNVLAGVVMAGLVYALADPIANFYGDPELANVTRVLSAVFFVNAVAAQFRAEVSRSFKFRWLAIADVSAQLFAASGAIIVATAGAGYWALVVQQLIAAFVTCVVLVAGARWLPRLPSRHASVRPFLTFGVNTTLVQLVNYTSANVDSVLIGRVWGASALGYYDRAYQIFRMPLMQIAAPMTRVALPVLSRLQDDERFQPYVERAQLILAYVMGGAFLLAAGAADPIIEIMLGPDWDPSKVIFQVLALGGLFQALAFVYHWVFMAKGRTGLQLRYTIISRTVMIGLIVGGVFLGPLGVAFASVLGLTINWIVLTVFAIPKVGVEVRPLVAQSVRPVLLFLAVGCVMAATAFLWQGAPALLMLVVQAAEALVMLALALVIPAIRRDAQLLVDTVRRAGRGHGRRK